MVINVSTNPDIVNLTVHFTIYSINVRMIGFVVFTEDGRKLGIIETADFVSLFGTSEIPIENKIDSSLTGIS